MISFLEIQNGIEALAPRGIAEFYSKFPDDPWLCADTDLREALEVGNERSIEHALTAYEARKVRLITLFNEFQSMFEIPIAKPRVQSAIESERVQLARLEWVRCDRCGANPRRAKDLRVFMGYVVRELGEPESVVRCLCDKCEAA